MPNPTLEQVKDFAAINMIPEKVAETYWFNFDGQGWVRANGQKIVKWQSHFIWWYRQECWKEKERKQMLYPIKNKFCEKCGMPAVFRTGGTYDHYYCTEHMPDKVKAKYE